MSASFSDDDRRTISARAYQRWEAEGRPAGRALEHWLAAEREMQDEHPNESETGRASRAAPPGRHASVEITNTDRALSPEERHQVRQERNRAQQSTNENPDSEAPPEAEHYIVLLDRSHLRIYRADNVPSPSKIMLQLEQALELPDGKLPYTARDTDQAGRFAQTRSGPAGGSIDERLPMQREQDRRLAASLASSVDTFLRQHASASWDFAAGPALHRAVLKQLSATTRHRLRRSLSKDLSNHHVDELRAHFRNAPPG